MSTLSGGFGGESLEQNWATSDVSGAEDGAEDGAGEEHAGAAVAAVEVEEEVVVSAAGNKRKPAVAHIPRGSSGAGAGSAKKKQRRGKRGEAQEEDAPLVGGAPVDVRDHIWSLYTHAMGDRLSALEQEDSMPAATRFHRSAADAAAIVRASLDDWETRLKKAAAFGGKKSPTVIVISGNSNRACAIIKQLNGLGLKLPIAKLFSRHMKVAQQKEMLANRGFACGVGTPNRVLKLLDLEYLNLKRTKLVILDMSRDLKGYHMLKQRDTAMDTANLLQRHLFAPTGAGCQFAVLV